MRQSLHGCKHIEAKNDVQMSAQTNTQKGAALIVVLGLVAVVAAWASTAAYEDMLSLRRAENALVSNKAELACLSALALAKEGLKQDARDSQSDNLEEIWAQPALPFPIDDGLVAGEVVDINRYFNLNSLINAQGQVDIEMVKVAKRLFRLKELDDGLVDVLVDWMDADDVPYGPSGMEDSGYYERDYKVKNAALDRFQELQLLAGFDADIVKALQDVCEVWQPMLGRVNLININTAEVDVLQAMFPLMNASDVEDLMAGRPYAQVSELAQQPWAQGAQAQGMLARLSVISNAFMVRTHAMFGRADWRENYALSRQAEKLTLRWRERVLWQ